MRWQFVIDKRFVLWWCFDADADVDVALVGVLFAQMCSNPHCSLSISLFHSSTLQVRRSREGYSRARRARRRANKDEICCTHIVLSRIHAIHTHIDIKDVCVCLLNDKLMSRQFVINLRFYLTRPNRDGSGSRYASRACWFGGGWGIRVALSRDKIAI